MKSNQTRKLIHIGLPFLAAMLLMAVWLLYLPGAANAQTTITAPDGSTARLAQNDSYALNLTESGDLLSSAAQECADQAHDARRFKHHLENFLVTGIAGEQRP